MLSRVLTFTIGALLAAVPAFSAITTYSTRTAWEMDVTVYTTVDFETYNVGGGTSGSVLFSGGTYTQQAADCSGALTPGQACFINNGNYTWSVDSGSLAPPNQTHKYFRLSDTSGTAYLQISLAPGTQAAAMNIFTGFGNYTVNLLDASSTVVGTYSNLNQQFFGFNGDTSIAMIRLSSNAFNEVYLDRLDFTEAPSSAETPESTSLAYMGLGMIALWLGSGKKVPSMRRNKPVQS